MTVDSGVPRRASSLPGRPNRRRGGRARAPGARRLLARIGLLAALAGSPLGLAGCRAVDFVNEIGKPRLDVARVEEDIRSGLQRDIEDESHSTASSVASVGRVRCRQRSETEASCAARISRGGHTRERRIAVSIDPRTGAYRWEVVD